MGNWKYQTFFHIYPNELLSLFFVRITYSHIHNVVFYAFSINLLLDTNAEISESAFWLSKDTLTGINLLDYRTRVLTLPVSWTSPVTLLYYGLICQNVVYLASKIPSKCDSLSFLWIKIEGIILIFYITLSVPKDVVLLESRKLIKC